MSPKLHLCEEGKGKGERTVVLSCQGKQWLHHAMQKKWQIDSSLVSSIALWTAKEGVITVVGRFSHHQQWHSMWEYQLESWLFCFWSSPLLMHLKRQQKKMAQAPYRRKGWGSWFSTSSLSSSGLYSHLRSDQWMEDPLLSFSPSLLLYLFKLLKGYLLEK